MPHLFSPLRIKDVTLKNRIAVSPMCQYSSTDGFANNWHLVHLGSRAVGGAGLIILEATAVSPEGRISPHDLGIWKDEHLEKLSEITRFLKEHGAVPGVQLAHAGRKASVSRPWEGNVLVGLEDGGWQTVSASAIPFSKTYSTPVALGEAGIEKVKQDFKAAAARALEAGFEVIEIHAAHGYLLHQFLSPVSNHRDDNYGGSLENRMRLTLEVVDAVKEAWPHNLPLFVRVSASDWTEGGWTLDDSVVLARELKAKGVDLIDASSGGNVAGAQIEIGPGYQVPFAKGIRQGSGIATGAVGIITTAQQANELIVNEQADLVLLARQMLRDPYFPLHAAKELGVDVEWPVQYDRAKV
jgi:2,4-dienoyl-CoA reductase-like NADH-dependent reductase (Old Yellow Enzyme family)